MPVVKKQCVNNEKYMYSGKEESPLGLGYAPDGELTSLYMKGRDTRTWMVSVKNGVKVWVRVPDEVSQLDKDTPVIKEAVDETPVVPPAPKKGPKPKATKIEEAEPKELKFEDDKVDDTVKPVEEVPKKKAVAKKKKVAVAEEAQVVEPEVVVAAAPVKKKAAPKKKVVVDTGGDTVADTETGNAPATKTKRPPNDYQKFMSYRMAQLKAADTEGKKHKEHFAQAASEWKTMPAEQKAEILAQNA